MTLFLKKTLIHVGFSAVEFSYTGGSSVVVCFDICFDTVCLMCVQVLLGSVKPA